MKDAAITDVLSLLTYKEAKKDTLIIEYGVRGDDFYLILEGECEVQLPDKSSNNDFNEVNYEIMCMKDSIEQSKKEVSIMKQY